MTLAASICAASLTTAATASAGGTVSARASASSPYDVTTDFAIAQFEAPIYHQPNTHSGVLNRLTFYTPDNEALQTYQFLGSRRVDGTLWEHIAVPMRPNGQTGWVKRGWLAGADVTHMLIVVSTSAETLTLYNHGKPVFTTPVGVGNTTDEYGTAAETPAGHFWIDEAFPSSDPFYGPWAFGTTARATDTDFPDDSIVGIHGTNDPGIIPGDVSHGCVRLKDPDILELKKLLGGDGIGTPVWIE